MKNILLLFILLVSFCAYAESAEWSYMNAWENSGFAMARIDISKDKYKTFQVDIGDDVNGKQVVEIIYGEGYYFKCNGDKLSDVVIVVSGKRIKTKVRCKSFMEVKTLVYYPTTNEGRAFVVKQFMLGEPVLIHMQGYEFFIPAKGFEKQWKKYGGDAI